MDNPILNKFLHFRRTAKRALKRLNNILYSYKKELSKANKWEFYKQVGDTLLANINKLKKGDVFVELENVYTGNVIKIELSPELPIKNNIDKYYIKSRKYKRAIKKMETQIIKTEKEIGVLTGITKKIEKIEETYFKTGLDAPLTDVAIQEISVSLGLIESELIENSYLPKNNRSSIKKSPTDKFKKYQLEGKWTVLAGKNNVQNDELTLHIAKPYDLWFHVYGSPGSHVVLRKNSREENVPMNVILLTASIAAWHSKQKHAKKVPVNYTEKRYVRKPRKSPPGLVVIEREKTVFVNPVTP